MRVISMRYETQGRQGHGWFGHGTMPKSASQDKSAANAAYAAVAGVPNDKRRAYGAMLDWGGLDRLRVLLPVWAAAKGGSRAFAQMYFGDQLGEENAAALRHAAQSIENASNSAEAAAASLLLSDAVNKIGVDRIPQIL
jgi:hypothetical protein